MRTDDIIQPAQDEVLYGRQTELGVQNFGTAGRQISGIPAFVRNFARVKAAAARANVQLGVLDGETGQAIEAACNEIIAGMHDAQFPTALVLGGGGTTTNMNFNEVIAARASQIAGGSVHANDHVNASQSTNDTYPTAMALTVRELADAPLAALEKLIRSLEAKGRDYENTVRLGRTCLQDAVTLTVGQTHRSHASALKRCSGGLEAAIEELASIPIGATVLGNGIGAPEGYRDLAVEELRSLTGRDLEPANDPFDALAHLDSYAAIASAAARAAITIAKIAADFRLLASGPGGGLAELRLPAVQAGSSIMPGKVNPVVPEYAMQLSYRIRGAAHTVECAVAAGELELNIMEPVIVDSLITILEDLTASAEAMATKCVDGLSWDGPNLGHHAEAGFDRWIAMAAEKGYDATVAEVQKARAQKASAVR